MIVGMRRVQIAILLLIVGLVMGGFRPNAAHAHTILTEGDFFFVTGWVNEPIIVGERNTIFIEIMYQNQPIQSADARLSIELVTDGQSKPVAAAGVTTSSALRYTFSFIPTQVGAYVLNVSGTLRGESIDVVLAPEPVNRADIMQFPNIALSNYDLQEAMIVIEERVMAAEQRANVGVGVGILGLVTGIAGVLFGRRNRSVD